MHDLAWIGPARRIVHLDHFAVRERDFVAHAGRGRDEIDIELTLQPLLDDLHMQQAEEAAAETEAERGRAFGLDGKRGIVEPQFFKRVAQHGVLMRVDRVQACEDHGLDVFKARQCIGCRPRGLGDGVTDLGVGNGFNGRDKEADLACRQLENLDRFGRQHAKRIHVELAVVRHEADTHALAQLAVDDTRQHDDAAVRVKPGVEDQRLQRRVRVTKRRRQTVDHGFKNFRHAEAGLRAYRERIGRVEANGFFDHLLRPRDVGRRQVDLVDDRDDFKPVRDGEVGIGKGLRFHALRGIDDQQRAFAGGERA